MATLTKKKTTKSKATTRPAPKPAPKTFKAPASPMVPPGADMGTPIGTPMGMGTEPPPDMPPIPSGAMSKLSAMMALPKSGASAPRLGKSSAADSRTAKKKRKLPVTK
jgi:hypothetical protein